MSQLFENVHILSEEDADEITRTREGHRPERISLAAKIRHLREASRISRRLESRIRPDVFLTTLEIYPLPK